MKLFQISDLHLNDKFKLDEYRDMLEKMTEIISRESEGADTIYLVCCGDIIDRGENAGYANMASNVLNFIRDRLTCKSLELIVVPGNHDLSENQFQCFQEFIKQYNVRIDFVNNNVLRYETPQLDFLLINTVFHKSIEYGHIDIKALKEQLGSSKKPIVAVMHHTLMSRYEDDRSGISNAYELLEQLEQNRVLAVLHGHTHGYSNILVGRECRVIGVGSLFAYFQNCNNQFNVVNIGPNQVESVTNYRYNFDLRNFGQELLYENQWKSSFDGRKASELYSQIRDSVIHYGGINNLNMLLTTGLAEYQDDMHKFFSEDIATAKLWLQESVPTTLYYNHGSYMTERRAKGIDYVIEELKRNSTSNRAIIPLIRFSDVLDGQLKYLPGLSSVQFGFADEERSELYCSVYLRSLEVNHFLRINLSEVFLLVSQICNEIRSINKLKINLYAFKAQYKEHFSCFKKARIDTMTPGELARILYRGDINRLIQLLKNKFEMQETVINTEGLERLYDLMYESKDCSEQCLDGLLNVIKNMKNLALEYRRSSDYHKIRPMENDVNQMQQVLLTLLEEKKGC